MKVSHYKPGDRVRTLKEYPGFGIRKGDVGTVSDSGLPKFMVPDNTVMVRFEKERSSPFGNFRFSDMVNIRECDLVPVGTPSDEVRTDEEKTPEQSATRHIVFDITNDGGTARYIDGKKTMREAYVRRSQSDEPNDFNAMMYLIGKLFPESEMSVRKVERDENVEADYPDIDGFARFRSPGKDPIYIEAGSIASVEYGTGKDGSKVVCIRTDEGEYEIEGYTVGEVMRKITEARGW